MLRTTKKERAAAMRQLRAVIQTMKRAAGRRKLPVVRLVWSWDCPGRRKWTDHAGVAHSGSYTPRAHTHIGGDDNRGTICIAPMWLLQKSRQGRREPGWTLPTNWPRLLAHEITHVVMPKVRHRTHPFEGHVNKLVWLYERQRLEDL